MTGIEGLENPSCGCNRRLGVCCAEAMACCRGLETALRLGITSGDWEDFDTLRARLEAHYYRIPKVNGATDSETG